VITAEGVSTSDVRRAIELDGVPLEATELTHAQLIGAASLHFVMAPRPR